MKIKNKSLSEKSRKWLKRHLNDRYVKLSKNDHYRSRAAYKLIEIDDKFKILNSSKSVIDLGGAPGSWSEVLNERLKNPKKIITIDLLEIQPIPNVDIVQDDFTAKSFVRYVEQFKPFDLIISDISPNLSGNKTADFLRMQDFVEIAFDSALKLLNKNGHFVTKYFRTGDMNKTIALAKRNFMKVSSFKPESSRKESSEIYLICLNKKN
tara:strand:+ start:199 stop:825 length:627 start_codon:yes stop_codon:yes gene_type:complete